MATGGYNYRSNSASSGGDNTSDDNCSEASSIYTSYSNSSSDDECMEEGDGGTGCKTYTLVKRCDHKEVGILCYNVTYC